MKPSQSLIRNRIKVLEIISSNPKFSSPRIFGSVARGDDTESSDIDIILKTSNDCSYLDLAALYLELKELLGCEIDLVTYDSLDDVHRLYIENEWKEI